MASPKATAVTASLAWTVVSGPARADERPVEGLGLPGPELAAEVTAFCTTTPPHIVRKGSTSISGRALTAGLAPLASSGLILLNKELLANGFPYPMALSSFGMGFSWFASLLCCRVFNVVKADKDVSTSFFLLHIMPVGLCMALTLWLGNLVYLYLTVSFIQILKAFSPVATMLLLFLARLETPSRRLVSSVMLIAGGVAVASCGELNLDYLGLFIMFLATATEAARLVMTQLLLCGLKFHPIEGLLHLAPACCFWLFVGSALLELDGMRSSGAFMFVLENKARFLAAAAGGFVVNWLGYVVIKTASSLTLKVIGSVKSGLLVVVGIVFLQEEVTLLQGVGYGVAVAAFFWYNHIKMQQLATEALPSGDKPIVWGRGGKEEALPLSSNLKSGSPRIAAHQGKDAV